MAAQSTPAKVRPLSSVKMRLPDGTRLNEKDVWNVSLGGVFIEMKEPLPFGAEVALEFVYPRDVSNLECDGYVVWSTATNPDKAPGKNGISIRLVSIGIKEMRFLAESVGRSL